MKTRFDTAGKPLCATSWRVHRYGDGQARRADEAKAILVHLEAEVRAQGLQMLRLLASKNVVEFYDQAGYERVETRTHETGGAELECGWMEQSLD